VPHSLELQEKFGDDLQVIFVHSQDATPEEVERFILAHKWMVDRPIWTNEQPFQTGSSGLPHATILGNDGKVIFNGSPDGSMEDLIAEQIKLAKKGSKDLPASCAKAIADFEKGSCSAALKALEAAPDAEKDAAKKVSATLTSRANAKLARLAWLIDNAEFEQADKLAPALLKSFAGDEKLEGKAKELSTKLASQELASEREAAKALDKIEARIAKDGLDGKSTPAIVKALTGVSEKFPKSTAAKRAEHMAALLKS
jgi:hypothetical protein